MAVAVIKARSSADWVKRFQWDRADGQPLHGRVLRLRAALTATPSVILVDISSPSSGIKILDPIKRRFEVKIPKAGLATMTSGEATFDITCTEPDGTTLSVLSGTIVTTRGAITG